jgi:hypothetical protein
MYDISVLFNLSPKNRRRTARSFSSSQSNSSSNGGSSCYYSRSCSPGSSDDGTTTAATTDLLSFPLSSKPRDSRNLITFSEIYSRSSEPGISLAEHVSGGGAGNLMDPYARIADVTPNVAGGKMYLLITVSVALSASSLSSSPPPSSSPSPSLSRASSTE